MIWLSEGSPSQIALLCDFHCLAFPVQFYNEPQIDVVTISKWCFPPFLGWLVFVLFGSAAGLTSCTGSGRSYVTPTTYPTILYVTTSSRLLFFSRIIIFLLALCAYLGNNLLIKLYLLTSIICCAFCARISLCITVFTGLFHFYIVMRFEALNQADLFSSICCELKYPTLYIMSNNYHTLGCKFKTLYI